MPMPWAISVHFSKADGADHKAWRLQESGMSKEQLSTAQSPCTISASCLRMVAGHRRAWRKPNSGTSGLQHSDMPRVKRSRKSVPRRRRRSKELSVLVPTDRQADVAEEVILELPHLAGNLLHDAHTAILMREHGIGRICTRDTVSINSRSSTTVAWLAKFPRADTLKRKAPY